MGATSSIIVVATLAHMKASRFKPETLPLQTSFFNQYTMVEFACAQINSKLLLIKSIEFLLIW